MKKFQVIVFIIIITLLFSACDNTVPVPTTLSIPSTENELPEGIRNIIIVIGDGMGDAQIQAGALSVGEEPIFMQWPVIHSNTNCLDDDGVSASKTTDSAAGGTALATGELTAYKRVGRDFDDETDLKNIMEYAKEYGKATGVVSTDSVYGATPASFSAHASIRSDYETIMHSQLKSQIDLICANVDQDSVALKNIIEIAGYTYISFPSEIGKNMDKDKLYCQLGLSGYNPQTTLEDIIPSVLDYLNQDPDGFVVMIEQAHIDKYCHDNKLREAAACAVMLNDGVDSIVDWVGDRQDTVVLVTADHETGGLQISTEDIYSEEFYTETDEKFYYQYQYDVHTPTPVSIFTYGFTPDWSSYYLDEEGTIVKNTAVFHVLIDLIKNPVQ